MNKNLRIIFTSDIHGYFFNTDYMDREVKHQGLLHLATRYNKDDETLIIDGEIYFKAPHLHILVRCKSLLIKSHEL